MKLYKIGYTEDGEPKFEYFSNEQTALEYFTRRITREMNLKLFTVEVEEKQSELYSFG